ncbi:hypothetical protein WICANDRAFT_24941 [Wickerhamomyces anomalus NRRL Y-366-8]|uniref:Complex 1 LYR protein domain-containing protein n=1 Tax=Wickerhamomyces anomalus (strain ATCC 58044 / CBS 1984 / NCYC 433 / NRRL Y-366-8) TaxID=683960 RepID=A0A1E3PA63_WICAA|nr:uncharacterized protein WICANDRAFT_24941 [Wickerhamomyces anomalus NRRL Y-366-8]ODQ62305.1 hypothetical protein WICANDRAFT_24941 [Wickerhamomyces anomalus NRRL Y-366-8]
MAAKIRKLSGLQKEVLKLYRLCIRASYTKPKENRQHFVSYTKNEFAKFQQLPKKEFSTIEHLLRTGYKKYEMFSAPEIKDVK